MSHIKMATHLLCDDTVRLHPATRPSPLPTIFACGDSAVLVDFERADGSVKALDEARLLERVSTLDRALLRHPPRGFIETVTAYRTLLVSCAPTVSHFEAISRAVLAACRSGSAAIYTRRRWRIPVAYGGAFGIDLADVAERLGTDQERIVDTHANAHYTVAMIGFLPGFAYLTGLPGWLALPRRATPRPLVPAGGIAIGGAQTAIGSIAGPSGWHQIGRTPVVAFDRAREPVTFLEAGDEIVLHRIDAAEFTRLAQAAADGEIVAERLT